VNLGPPVNTQYEESAAAMSADGLSLYFNRNYNGQNPAQPGKVDEDVYVAQRTSRQAPWGEPVALDAINTSSHERNATLSRDGSLLFFSSNRLPSSGGLDLYVSHRIAALPSAPNGWSAPVSLGAAINSTLDDIGPGYFQNADGTGVLYFTSNRPGRGGFDIYTSEARADGSFGTPVLEQALSGTSNEARTAIRSDGLEVVFQTNRPNPNVGLADLWVSTRPTLLDPWGAPTSLGPTINSTGNDRQPALSDDGEVLLFASVRLGVDDIWISERDCTEGPNAPVTDADGDGIGDACDLAFSTPGSVGGSVGATLSLSLGSAASFGPFTPGVAKDYLATAAATVISTAGDAALSVTDPSPTAPGRLLNGAFSLPQALQARAALGSFATVGSTPALLLTYTGPTSNDAVSLEFKQVIGANDALRSGTYSKTLTYTLSTTTP
jgi:hypothetical protein